MAVEQDWALYADQAYLSLTDTILARSSGGAGVEILGSRISAQRSAGGPFTMAGDAIVDNGVAVGTNALGWGRIVTSGSALYIQSGSANTSGGSPNSIVFGNMYGGAGGIVQPGGDNVQALGIGSFRWSVVYAGTGAINTSDEREKVWRGGLTNAEARAARRIIAELGFFQWKDAVATKDDDARYHFGVRAQRVWAIMAEEGLVEPIGADGRPGKTPYAFLCFDEWEAAPPTPELPEQVDDKTGEVIRPFIPASPGRPAGNRFGLRAGDLTLFLVAAMEARLAALEEAGLEGREEAA